MMLLVAPYLASLLKIRGANKHYIQINKPKFTLSWTRSATQSRTLYMTTQATILHVDWLGAGRNRYRSTSIIASSAAALVVERTVPSGSVQYYTRSAACPGHTSHLTLTLPKQLGTHPIVGEGHPNHVGTCPLSIAWEVLQ